MLSELLLPCVSQVKATAHATTAVAWKVQQAQAAKLDYELAMQRRLSAGGDATAADDVEPHIRLVEGTRALILPDGGGQPLSATHAMVAPSAGAGAAAAPSSTSTSTRSSSSAVPLHAEGVVAVLRAGVGVALLLQRLHAYGLVHKALHPASTLYCAATGCAQFVDMSAASLLVQERVEPNLPSTVHAASTWLYLSPEQSGKANRSIDSRSDLYSLGCCLFEMLSGQPPFVASDPLEIVHQHLAKAPPSFLPKSHHATSNPQLYALLKGVQSVTLKLLQKEAEDRYQSAEGLVHDLRLLLAAAVQAGDASVLTPSAAPLIASFEAGQLDLASTFRLSQRLYGREESVAVLRAAYMRVATVKSAMLPYRHLAGGATPAAPPPAGLSVEPQLVLVSGSVPSPGVATVAG
jgi:hypothetical protein